MTENMGYSFDVSMYPLQLQQQQQQQQKQQQQPQQQQQQHRQGWTELEQQNVAAAPDWDYPCFLGFT